MEIMRTEEMQELPEEYETERELNENARADLHFHNVNVQTRESYLKALRRELPEDKPLYESDFDAFWEKYYGSSDDYSGPIW